VRPEPPGRRHPAPQPPRQRQPVPPRPLDVDTGFWLWLIALPLQVTGYIVDLVVLPRPASMPMMYAVSAVFVLVLAAVVVTFLILMRQGYRWARTVLTGGGVASVVYSGTSLFTAERPTVAAIVYAITAIVGSVLILGGAYLLHRKDAHAYFVR
jgi:hypothetical protein